MTRRTGSQDRGLQACNLIRSRPGLRQLSVDKTLLDLAQDLGTRYGLRSMDSLYAATARLTATPLISWDKELIDRVGAISPETWLAENTS